MHQKPLCLVGLFLISTLSQALAGTTGNYPAYSGQKKMAIILLNWKDKPCPTTRQTIVDRMWNNSNSVRHYYRDMSRNVFDFIPPADAAANGTVPATTTAVYGPYTLSIAEGFDKDVTYANADDLYGGKTVPNVKAVAASLAAARDGYKASNYNYVMYVTPKCDTTGGIGGYAGYGSNYCHMFDVRQNYLNHELGHDFSLSHSNTKFDVDGYDSQDCVMGNQNNAHLDGPHSYQVGWYPDACYPVRSYGQYDIENLAQPNTDNAKVLRFDRSAHGATSNSNYDLWVEYRVKGVGQDSGLNTNWNQKVNIHLCKTMSNRPTDDYFAWGVPNNNVSKFTIGGSYTEPDNKCKVQFLRSTSTHATVQLINPSGNQPPSISDQSFVAGLGTPTNFTVQANDPENKTLTYTIITAPAVGTLIKSGSTFTYTGSKIGSYTCTVRVNDGQYDSFDATLTIGVIDTTPLVVSAGIDQTVTLSAGTGGNLPVGNAFLEWNAAADTAGDGSWRSETAINYNWTFAGGNKTAAAVTDSRFDAITKAYVFPAAKSGSLTTLQNTINENGSGTWEFVLDTDADDGLILESGGATDGFQFWIQGGMLKGQLRVGGTNISDVSYQLKAADKSRLIHVLYVIDMGTAKTFKLYVDGVERSSAAWTGADYCGGDSAALGTVGGTAPSGSVADFTGKMALIRYYEGKAFAITDVATNFSALSLGPQATVTLNGTCSKPSASIVWTKLSGPSGVVFSNTASTTTAASFTSAGTYVLRLSAADGYNAPASDEVVITVNDAGPAGYSAWAAGYGSFDSAMGSNPDGDGRNNMMEFAFGTNPTLTDLGPLAVDGTRHGDPVLHKPEGEEGFWLYFIRRVDYGSSGLNYTACFSDDLASFEDSMVGLEVVTTSGVNSNYQVVRVPFPTNAKFGCIRVEVAP